MTFAQYIVFTEEMYQSAVNDNAVDAYPTVVIGVTFVSIFVDGGDQSLVPNIGEEARAEEDVEEFKNSQLELGVCICDNFIDTINTTGLFGLEGL